jgi:hypothetical protein
MGRGRSSVVCDDGERERRAWGVHRALARLLVVERPCRWQRRTQGGDEDEVPLLDDLGGSGTLVVSLSGCLLCLSCSGRVSCANKARSGSERPNSGSPPHHHLPINSLTPTSNGSRSL